MSDLARLVQLHGSSLHPLPVPAPGFHKSALQATRCILLLLLLSAIIGADTDPFGETKPTAKTPNSVQSLLDKADAEIAKIRDRAREDEIARRAALVHDLEKIQTEYTKKGDLDTALLIKGKIEEQRNIAMAAESKQLSRGPITPAAKLGLAAPALVTALDGTYNFVVPGGIIGKMVISGDKATDLRSGYTGTIKFGGNATVPSATIHWVNETEWIITLTNEKYSLVTRDGMGKIEKERTEGDGISPLMAQFASHIVGKWKALSNTGWSAIWIFTATSVTSTEGSGVGGTYKIINNKINVIWANGVTDVIDTVVSDTNATGTSGHGSAISISRL